MKETNCCVDVAGEDFSDALEEGCKYSTNESGPYRRTLPHMEDRNKRVLDGGRGNFRAYDETETINQS